MKTGTYIHESELDDMRRQRDDLRRQLAEREAVIKTHDLCHDLHGKVGVNEFAEGCRREMVKHFGSCPWDERDAELQRLREVVGKLPKFGALLDSKWTASDAFSGLIHGYWAEDFSTYHITMPHQLRDMMVELQNILCDALAAAESAKDEAQAQERE